MSDPMITPDRTPAITARYTDWYESRDDWQEDGLTADWSHRDSPETLSHAIVREDIPWLLERLAEAEAARARLQQRTDDLTATISEARAADLRAIEYGDTDRQRLENVFGLLDAPSDEVVRAIKSPAWVVGYQTGSKHQFESSRYRSSLTVGPELEPPAQPDNPYDSAGRTDPIGNDGLTDTERAGYAAAYERATRPLDSEERNAIAKWRETRAVAPEETTRTADRSNWSPGTV